MENYIIIGILVIVLGLAAFYVYQAKKKGKKCIGCPDSDTCAAKKDGCGCCGCGHSTEQ